MKPFRAVLTVSVTALLIAGPAAFGAQDGEFQTKNTRPGQWDNPDTWEIFDSSLDPSGWRDLEQEDATPSNRSTVTIRAGHTVIVEGDESIGRLRMQRGTENTSGAVLDINGGSLEINRALSMVKRPKTSAPPRIVFSARTGRPGLLQANQGIAIGGTIEVTGEAGGIVRLVHPDHHISFGGRGVMAATGGPLTIDGEIEMDGQVIADGPYQVTIIGAGPRIGSSGKWRLAHPKATIRFDTNRDLNLRSAKFLIDDGTLDVAVRMETSGEIRRSKRGVINVRAGGEFNARGVVRNKD